MDIPYDYEYNQFIQDRRPDVQITFDKDYHYWIQHGNDFFFLDLYF